MTDPRLTLRITNTLSGKTEKWSSPLGREVKLYVCGITAYDHCHLGHARSAIVFDVIRNYLEYRGQAVRYVKNFTDLDDKIILRGQKEGRDWKEVAEQFIGSYERDMARLRVRPPTVAPKATDHIPDMIRMIERLISKGMAYPMEGSVYFRVEQLPAYGALSKQKKAEMMVGARVEVDERKSGPLDFALWKKSKPGEPEWPSPWGMGRPGWHIECSAMAIAHLGETLDLHGGGLDLIFPHHENEIAQSEGCTGVPFSSCWIHHGFVTVHTEKMSKSLGNSLTIEALFEKSSHDEAVVAEVIRFYFLSTHYRAPIDFSDGNLTMAKASLDRFYTLFQKLSKIAPPPFSPSTNVFLSKELLSSEGIAFVHQFETAMDDDFNSPRAIGLLQTFRATVNRGLSDGSRDEEARRRMARQALVIFEKIGVVFGLFSIPSLQWPDRSWNTTPSSEAPLDEATLEALLREREEARRNKEWSRSDAIRDRLLKAGMTIEDQSDGPSRIKR